MDARSLRPCPFCAGVPTLVELDPSMWVVICNTCKAIGPHPETEQDAEAAAQRWNEQTANRAKQT
jgi:hypothetical protein